MIASEDRTDMLERCRARAAVVGWALVVLAGLTAGCHILDVSNPDVVLPASLTGAAALPTIRPGVSGAFGVAYTGPAAQGPRVPPRAPILLGALPPHHLSNTPPLPHRALPTP